MMFMMVFARLTAADELPACLPNATDKFAYSKQGAIIIMVIIIAAVICSHDCIAVANADRPDLDDRQ